MKSPAWAAAPGFARAWASVASMHSQARNETARSWSDAVLRGLREARVITVSREQVDVLPYLFGPVTETPSADWTVPLASEMGVLQMPFDVVFVDLGGARIEGWEDDTVALGVLLLQLDSSGPISGVGFTSFPDGSSCLPSLCPVANEGKYVVHKDPLGVASATQPRETTIDCVERAISVLRWLESVNVDLVETPLTGAQRKRAGRKGQAVPLVVSVRQSQRRPRRSSEDKIYVQYSHRWEVAGHYMHFRRGPTFEATPPEKLCDVPSIGLCRRVWCPPHVKGPESKPLVPKVRVVQ